MNQVTTKDIFKMETFSLMEYLKNNLDILKKDKLDYDSYNQLKDLSYKALECLFYKSELLAMPYSISLREYY